MEPIFIFDIDGVITHPHIKKPNDIVLSFIARELHKKKPVALATGRALVWIEKNIIPFLREKLIEPEDIDTLFISGEKGGVWMEFAGGKTRHQIDESIHFPKGVVKEVISHIRNQKEIFFDADKYTMVSVEIEGGKDREQIKKQKEVLDNFEMWVKGEIPPKYPNIDIDPSEISVDLLVRGIDKRLSAKGFLSFLDKKQMNGESFVIFGDSPSDTLVAGELQDHKKSVRFFYVGKEKLTETYPFPVIVSNEKLYDQAVVDFLKEHFSDY